MQKGYKFKWHINANQQTAITDDCQGMKSNGESLEIVENCYLGDKIGGRGSAFGSIKTRIMSGWSKFKDLMPLLAGRGLLLGAKWTLYFVCIGPFMQNESNTWRVREENGIRLERNDARKVRQMNKDEQR